MKFASLLLGLSFLAAIGMGCNQKDSPTTSPDAPLYVLMTFLVGSPTWYDGRLVRVAGYCRIEFEGNGLYVDRQTMEDGGSKVLWLDVGWPVTDEIRALNGQFVIVDAIVDSRSHGHWGAYRGTLTHIQRIQATTPERERESMLNAMGFPK
jgi:hypothetical protein